MIFSITKLYDAAYFQSQFDPQDSFCLKFFTLLKHNENTGQIIIYAVSIGVSSEFKFDCIAQFHIPYFECTHGPSNKLLTMKRH